VVRSGFATTIRYYIDAKAPGPAGDSELMLMLRSLLAERFQLALHPENRDLTGYALVVAKGGLKAKPSAPEAPNKGDSRRGGLDAEGATMAYLATKISGLLHLPVVDSTAIEGRFDIHLRWTTEDEMQAKPSVAGRQSGASAVLRSFHLLGHPGTARAEA
jgi:uncharacterized protein (TIGR03435 family)